MKKQSQSISIRHDDKIFIMSTQLELIKLPPHAILDEAIREREEIIKLAEERDILQKRVAELEKILSPIVSFYDNALKGFTAGWEERRGDSHVIFGWNGYNFTVGMFRQARDVLKKKGE